MSRPPDRRRRVFFLGAGFSSIAGLPNTASLLSEVHHLAQTHNAWGVSKNLENRLSNSYSFFYPDEGHGFQPEVVDFFSVLSSYNQIDNGNLPEGFPDRDLLSDLRFAIAHVLCERLRGVTDEVLRNAHNLLDEMVARGNVVITTNWDTLVERAAAARRVPHRLSGAPDSGELLVLKLHGSIDWLLRGDAKKPLTKANYAAPQELLGSTRARTRTVKSADVLRTRIANPGALWRTLKGATKDPFMLTMSPAKGDALAPLIAIWEGAYRAVSAAHTLEIIGYSMPEDDIAIRTLLRAGVKRGPQDPGITVRNPAPDVHARVRRFINTSAASDYIPVAVL